MADPEVILAVRRRFDVSLTWLTLMKMCGDKRELIVFSDA
jgi:hypothetical protein